MTMHNRSDACNMADILLPVDGRELRQLEEGGYFLPSAGEENEILQMQHFLFRCIWKNNYSAPIRDRSGSGNWILDLAMEFPSSIFIGIDTSSSHMVQLELPNTAFFQHDLTEGLPFPDDTFHFVHQRFSTANEGWWKNQALAELIRVLKPEGWIELMEMHNFCSAGPMTKRLEKSFTEFLRSRGIYRLEPSQLQNFLEATKFLKNIQCETRITPLGSWGGRVGELVCRNFLQRFEASKAALSEFMEITEDEFGKMLDLIREEIDTCKSFCKTYRVYGKKA